MRGILCFPLFWFDIVNERVSLCPKLFLNFVLTILFNTPSLKGPDSLDQYWYKVCKWGFLYSFSFPLLDGLLCIGVWKAPFVLVDDTWRVIDLLSWCVKWRDFCASWASCKFFSWWPTSFSIWVAIFLWIVMGCSFWCISDQTLTWHVLIWLKLWNSCWMPFEFEYLESNWLEIEAIGSKDLLASLEGKFPWTLCDFVLDWGCKKHHKMNEMEMEMKDEHGMKEACKKHKRAHQKFFFSRQVHQTWLKYNMNESASISHMNPSFLLWVTSKSLLLSW